MFSPKPIRSALLWAGLSISLVAQQTRGPLTDPKVLDLVTAGVRSTEIIRIIQSAPTVDFDLRPVSTDALTKAGVSDEVIKAMAAKESGVPVSAISTTGAAVKPSISESAEFNSKLDSA
jgi:hypothetical protein